MRLAKANGRLRGLPAGSAVAALVLVAVSACGADNGDNGEGSPDGETGTDGAAGGAADGEGSDYPSRPVTLTAPSDPGGGWDTTARALVQAMEEEGLTDSPIPVQNRPGAVGCVWMNQMMENHRGDEYQLAMTSTPVMSNYHRGDCEYSYEDITMIATLIVENFVVVTGGESPYETADDLLQDIADDPQSVPIAASGDDQLPFALLVQAAGGDPSAINFVQYEGGGQQTTALLNGDAAAAIAGVSEFRGQLESGEFKGLTVLRDEPLTEPLDDIPTTVDLGYDVTVGNWRGVYGPPEMPDFAIEYWENKFGEVLDTPTWDELAERNQWDELYLVGDEMNDYLAEADEDYEEALRSVGAID